MSSDPRYELARREVESLKGFYIHLVVYVLVNALLIAINLASGPEWWFQWPLIGWGVGLLGHAVLIWSPARRFARDWEQRKLKERLQRH